MHITRLKKRADFLVVNQKGVRIKTPSFSLLCCTREKDSIDIASMTRVGYTASRRVGNAVARNRCKRRLRALVSLFLKDYYKISIPSDIVFVAYSGLVDRSFENIKMEFINALGYLSRKQEKYLKTNEKTIC